MEQLPYRDQRRPAFGELHRADPARERRRLDLSPTIAQLAARFVPRVGWRDFRTLAGESVDWPTAYVAAALQAAGAGEAAERAIAPLARDQQANGGWGYHAGVPDDADSTAYAVAFLLGTSAVDEARRGAERLAAQQRGDGGIATYGDGEAIRLFMGLPAEIDLGGWTAPQVEVTASAGRALALAGARERAEQAWAWLKAAQRADGGWSSYWWTSDLYATAQALRLASAIGRAASPEAARAVDWCRSGQQAVGAWTDDRSGRPSAFATALGLIGLGGGHHGEAQRRGRAWLLSARRRDGGWDGEYSLRLPPPWVRDPSEWPEWTCGGLGVGAVVRDAGGSYVTATALLALCG